MSEVLDELFKIILERKSKMPEGSYTTELIKKGRGYIARKVGEEAVEFIVASLSESKERIISEAADLLYHMLVLLAINNIDIGEVYQELRARMRK
ncbi:MAG: phosphoribosyl-ATP diphosphatase [Sulfolobaceae archaeon]